MFGIFLFLTAISTISAEGNNFESILNSLRSQNLEFSSDETSSSDSSDGPVGDQHKRMDLENLVNFADALSLRNKNSRLFYPPYKGHHPVNIYYTPENKRVNDRKKQLAQKNRKERKHVKVVKNRKPKNLSHPVQMDGNSNVGEKLMNYMNDNSKIYVVLDPESLQSKTKRDEISSILSRILAGISSASAAPAKRANHFRGYNLKNNLNLRRYRRDSKEMYGGGGGSMEDDYRPKRSRSEHSGGGRTAIPFIRHRGDIYEREN